MLERVPARKYHIVDPLGLSSLSSSAFRQLRTTDAPEIEPSKVGPLFNQPLQSQKHNTLLITPRPRKDNHAVTQRSLELNPMLRLVRLQPHLRLFDGMLPIGLVEIPQLNRRHTASKLARSEANQGIEG